MDLGLCVMRNVGNPHIASDSLNKETRKTLLEAIED